MNIQHGAKQFQVPRWVKHYSNKKVFSVKIVLKNRSTILLPMIDLIYTEIESGKHILSGKVFDIFE